MTRSNWLIGIACALYVGVVVTPTGFYEAIWKLATGVNSAAWVQAFGAILALVVAIGLGVWQAWNASRIALHQVIALKMNELQRALGMIHIAIGYGSAINEELDRMEGLGSRIAASHTESEALISALASLPAHEFQTASSAIAVHKLRATLARYCDRRETLRGRLLGVAEEVAQKDERAKQISKWMSLDRAEIRSQIVILHDDAHSLAERMRALVRPGILGLEPLS